jgi:NADPH:quinone reductase-like Zn-dependent oxidoreductase
MLSNEWTIHDFYPMDWLPNGTRLTAYSGEASDLTPSELQGFLDAIAAGHASVPIGRVYQLEDIQQAHRDMESGAVAGKLVVLTRPAP